jgi:hypothetical protein
MVHYTQTKSENPVIVTHRGRKDVAVSRYQGLAKDFLSLHPFMDISLHVLPR